MHEEYDRLGDAIASPLLRLVDDPTDLRSLGADSHDGEGLATRRNVLIDDGVLRGFLYDGTTGRRAGAPSTASAVRGSRSLLAQQALALFGEGTGLLLLGSGGREHAIAWRIAQATGADLLAGYANAHMTRGRGRLPVDRSPGHCWRGGWSHRHRRTSSRSHQEEAR